MKKIVSGLVAFFILLGSAYADDLSFETWSLIGIEGGYSSFDLERDQVGTPVQTTTYNKAEAGIKIGAQTQNYRLFLSMRDYFVSDFDYLVTYGVEGQYLFNFSKVANLFIGINAGAIDAKLTIANESRTRSFSDPYFGGDLGFNFHIGESFDLELGARVMTTDAQNTINGVTYKIDTLTTGYVSFIYKYQMDD